MQRLLSGALLVAGILSSLYGLFAVIYNGDTDGGDGYVTWAGHEIDADLAGGLALTVGLLLLVTSLLLLRRRRTPAP